MPEAVIVATARSPIGRAVKGSLVDHPARTTWPRRSSAPRWTRCPQLDPHDIDDLMLGCGLPGGEPGFNIGRVVAVLLGYDFLPGTTITRYCSSSLQTTRMAMHAIKAGEGDVFISAGVETVSRFVKGSSDGWPDTQNPLFAEAEARTAQGRRERRRRVARPARGRRAARRLHRDGPDRGEPGAAQGRQPRGDGPLRRPLAEPGREGHRRRLLGRARSPR